MDFAAFLSNLGNNLGFGLIVTLIGMLTVFFGLVLLIGLIKLMEMPPRTSARAARRARSRRKRPLPRRLPRPWWKKCPWRMPAS